MQRSRRGAVLARALGAELGEDREDLVLLGRLDLGELVAPSLTTPSALGVALPLATFCTAAWRSASCFLVAGPGRLSGRCAAAFAWPAVAPSSCTGAATAGCWITAAATATPARPVTTEVVSFLTSSPPGGWVPGPVGRGRVSVSHVTPGVLTVTDRRAIPRAIPAATAPLPASPTSRPAPSYGWATIPRPSRPYHRTSTDPDRLEHRRAGGRRRPDDHDIPTSDDGGDARPHHDPGRQPGAGGRRGAGRRHRPAAEQGRDRARRAGRGRVGWPGADEGPDRARARPPPPPRSTGSTRHIGSTDRPGGGDRRGRRRLAARRSRRPRGAGDRRRLRGRPPGRRAPAVRARGRR